MKPESIREIEMPQLMRDTEIEQFIRCSGCYYRICSGSHELSWRQLTQQSVDEIVRSYHSMPIEARTPAFIMDSAEQKWTDDYDKFNSLHHYRQVKRISTKYLMQYLSRPIDENALSLHTEPMSVFVKDLDLELSMMFHSIERTDRTFFLRKFFVSDEPEVIKAFFHMSIIFSYIAFDRLPDRVEAISLLNGKLYEMTPDINAIQESYDYLYLLVGTMREGVEARNVCH